MKCLICYNTLSKDEIDYHPKCVNRIFGVQKMPVIELNEKKLMDYAKKILEANNATTGVQPKLSLWLEETKKQIRFTIADKKSDYIIKPQNEYYVSLPENEDLCMHLAEEIGIDTAKHALVRLPSGNLAYISKRFDRNGIEKLACEDLCQLSELLTEHKYRGSHEKTGKIIREYSTQSGLDALHYFQLVLFSFITGNADMHLKNFSMLEKNDGAFVLSPAYDLVNTRLVIKEESEQMSLTINGRKNKLTKKDFDVLGASLQLNEKQIQNSYTLFSNKIKSLYWWIENSFLPNDQKKLFKKIVKMRIDIISPK